MFFLRKYYRWRYLRRQRAQSYRPFIGAGKGIGISFGRQLARSTREGKQFSGFRDRQSRRKQRLLKATLALLGLIFLGWIIYESVYGLSLF